MYVTSQNNSISLTQSSQSLTVSCWVAPTGADDPRYTVRAYAVCETETYLDAIIFSPKCPVIPSPKCVLTLAKFALFDSLISIN